MLNNDWDIVLNDIFRSDDFKNFMQNLQEDYKNYTIYPKYENIFNALKYTEYKDIKVVILGQDPYHNEGEANGLAFSVNSGVKLPPSLRNIFKEIKLDLNIENINGDLTNWSKQGVLLLNTVLTVKKNMPKSYSNTYWNFFTDEIIKRVSKKSDVIFLLWGNDAKEKEVLIKDNYILKTTHPSPFSAYRGFLGSKIFSKTNEILKSLGKEEIDWTT